MLLVTEGEREKRCEEGLPSSVIFLDEKLQTKSSLSTLKTPKILGKKF